MRKEYVVMGLHCVLLFAYFAAAEVWAQYEKWTPSYHWTEEMTIKNPENNPAFNHPDLGSLQDAWQVLEETSNETYFLLFRSSIPLDQKCFSTTANITDKTNKTANYTIMSYDTKEKKYENITLQVKALTQTDYPLENVIRANFEGKLPNATPVPPGRYTYAECGNTTCFSSGTSFPDKGNAREFGGFLENALDELFYIPENADDFDMYVVYNEPQCYILRNPGASGGCDLWLRKTELKKIVDDLEDEIIKKEEELYKNHVKKILGIYEDCTPTDKQKAGLRLYVDDDIRVWFQDIVWKRISLDCVLAFMITCGEPLYEVYNPITCNTSLTGQ
ncbi:uncharacterized protein LOC120850089 [Ixodes scapularis]|uniref:uncharacterized protein LOC120850089 n=1 Tax=Ixodes scapularis TaxID=6945 RepID=UPI001C38E96D|nr:uncharacterized protein LOC120850089 [Ixodes scapularis]